MAANSSIVCNWNLSESPTESFRPAMLQSYITRNFSPCRRPKRLAKNLSIKASKSILKDPPTLQFRHGLTPSTIFQVSILSPFHWLQSRLVQATCQYQHSISTEGRPLEPRFENPWLSQPPRQSKAPSNVLYKMRAYLGSHNVPTSQPTMSAACQPGFSGNTPELSPTRFHHSCQETWPCGATCERTRFVS